MTRPPLQVLLPAVLVILVGPAVLIATLVDSTGNASSTEHLLTGVIVALAVSSVACAVLLLRRSAWARRWLLLLSCLIALAQFAEYELSDVSGTQLAAVRHAGVTILAVLALSSPVATRWCRRTDHSAAST